MFLNDDLDDLANPETITWIGIEYEYKAGVDTIGIRATVVFPQTPELPDVSHFPPYEGVPVHVLRDTDADYEIVQSWRIGHPDCSPPKTA